MMNTDDITRLPCPFCGGNDIRTLYENIGYDCEVPDWTCFCMDCDAVAALGRCSTELESINAWNKRAPSDQTIPEQ